MHAHDATHSHHADACRTHQCSRPSKDGARQQCPRSGAALRCIPPAHTNANLGFVSELAVLQQRKERTRQTVLCQPRPPHPPRPTTRRYPCPDRVHPVQVQHKVPRPRETSQLSPRWQNPRPSLSVRACAGPFRSRCMLPARQRWHQHTENCFSTLHFAVFVLCCACKACKFRWTGRHSHLAHGRMGAWSDGTQDRRRICHTHDMTPMRHMTHATQHMTHATHGQLANIAAQTDTMITGLKQSVSKDGGHEGTPTLLVPARPPIYLLAPTYYPTLWLSCCLFLAVPQTAHLSLLLSPTLSLSCCLSLAVSHTLTLLLSLSCCLSHSHSLAVSLLLSLTLSLSHTALAVSLSCCLSLETGTLHKTHAGLLQHTCNTHATNMQHTCNTHATHLQHTCNTLATHMQHISDISDAGLLQHTCNTHATHRQHTCNTYRTQVYCNNMVVGRAESQFSAAVSFYKDKVCACVCCLARDMCMCVLPSPSTSTSVSISARVYVCVRACARAFQSASLSLSPSHFLSLSCVCGSIRVHMHKCVSMCRHVSLSLSLSLSVCMDACRVGGWVSG